MNVEHVWIRNRTGTISASTQHLDPINYQTLLGVQILRFKYSFIPGYLSVTISEYNYSCVTVPDLLVQMILLWIFVFIKTMVLNTIRQPVPPFYSKTMKCYFFLSTSFVNIHLSKHMCQLITGTKSLYVNVQ